MSEPAIRAKNISATIVIETSRIEGSLRVIRDVGGINAAQTAANVALRRITRKAMNDNEAEGWIG